MAEQKYWITPKGKILRISQYNIDEHFKFFNDTEIGREMKILYNFKLRIKPENLYFVLEKGFIRVLELNEILNISYAGHSTENQIPVSREALDSLFTFLLNPQITDIHYDCFTGSKSHSAIISKKEFVKLFEKMLNFDQSLIDRILNT